MQQLDAGQGYHGQIRDLFCLRHIPDFVFYSLHYGGIWFFFVVISPYQLKKKYIYFPYMFPKWYIQDFFCCVSGGFKAGGLLRGDCKGGLGIARAGFIPAWACFSLHANT